MSSNRIIVENYDAKDLEGSPLFSDKKKKKKKGWLDVIFGNKDD